MTQEELLSVAEVIERLVKRFEEQGAEHARKMAEHRASFGARTEADAKIIEGLRQQIETLNREERAAHDARPASSTPKQHPVKVGEWVRRTKLPGDQSPVGIVKQVTAIDCDGERYHFSDGDYWSIDNCEPCKRQHPAQNGQLVRRTVASGTHPVGAMIQIERSRTLHEEYVTRGGRVVPWAHCEPCDPPVDHDTPAGKEAAESVIRDFRMTEIKVGDVVEVVSNTGGNTWLADVGSVGTVTSVETIEDSLSVRLADVPGKKNVLAGYVSLCDVRKVPQ